MLGFLGDIYLAADLEIGNARHAGEIPEPKACVAGPGNANQPPQQRAPYPESRTSPMSSLTICNDVTQLEWPTNEPRTL